MSFKMSKGVKLGTFKDEMYNILAEENAPTEN